MQKNAGDLNKAAWKKTKKYTCCYPFLSEGVFTLHHSETIAVLDKGYTIVMEGGERDGDCYRRYLHEQQH